MITHARNNGGIFNGCTDHYLRKKYGSENVKHILGKGWYKLTEAAK